MYNVLAPRYLSSLIPNPVGNITSYNLRNSSNLNISCRSQLLSKSLIHQQSTLGTLLLTRFGHLWTLSEVARTYRCSITKVIVRHVSIMLDFVPTAAISTNISLHKNIVESPLCTCGNIEDTYHFFFSCPLYMGSRFELYNQLFAYRPLTVPLLFWVVTFLYGSFCHGFHKLDLSTLLTTFFLWTSLPFILHLF